MNSDEDLIQANLHLKAQTLELASANERLTLELAAQKRVMEALQGSAQGLRSLAAISADWYWEQDAEYRFIDFAGKSDIVNPHARLDDVEGQCRWELPGIVPLDVSWEAHRALLDARQPFRDFEYLRVLADGLPRYISVNGVPVFDSQDQFIGYRGTTRDISARKHAETALRASEARFRTALAAMAEGVVLRDANARIVDCNASAERIFGKTLAQLKGSASVAPEWQMLREDGSPMPDEERPSATALRTGLPQSDVVIGYRKPDGSVLWGLSNIHPLLDGTTSTPSGFVSTITDISQRKRAETDIVRLNVNLENRVLRRTAQLEVANKELEAFSYSMAHDLRTPLSTIDGFSALLQKVVPTESGQRAQHYLGRIRGGVRRMGELIDGLLSLAHLSRTSLNWATVDMSAEATTVIQQCLENDAARVVQVTVEPGLLVRADPSLLRQVLENLIANAWKFTSKKNRAEISVGQDTCPDQQPVYFVRDNGAGFDMAYADKLFGTFERLHAPEEFSGSGLGLATVKRIITRHGGKIWAQSSLGEGSTFYFTLGSDPGHAAQGESPGSDGAHLEPAQALPSRQLPGNVGDTPASAMVRTSVGSDHDAFSISDQQFSNAFEHAAIGMTVIGLDSRLLRVNSAFCQMLGYSEPEMLARTVREITHSDDIDYDLLQTNRSLAGEIESYQCEKRYIHRSGRLVWVYLTSSLVRDADRRPLHFVSQVQDITERKESERVLRESEERFRTLTALSSDWFWEQDENFRFVYVSGEAANTMKFARENVTGMTRWELDHKHMDDAVWVAHKALLERHEVFRDFEITLLDNKGEIRYESISGVPMFDTSGRFTGYRGTGRDNTALRRVTDALHNSELQLRQITDTVPALIAYIDVEQRFRFHNRAYEEAFGLSHEQFEGKTLHEVMGDELYETSRTRVEEVLSGYPVVYERTQKIAHGDLRDYVVNYFPRYGEGADEGKVVGFFSLGTDVTELKRIDRMKTEFVSTVSHELRTPLTSIRGSLGLIAGGVAGELPEAVRGLVGIATNNCERLIRLINDILDSEKIESGKIRLDLQVVDINLLIQQALAANEGFAAQHGVSLVLQAPVAPLQVRIDSDRMIQVLTNLLSNAVKFSPSGGMVEVQVSQGGIGVRVQVRDHGPGVPEDFRDRIFQKFSQADSSDTRQKAGTGLGLSISRALVEKMGGNIGFSSGTGTGTTFFFELPEWVPSVPLAKSLQHQTQPSRARILICEDDPDVAKLISMMLGNAGFDTDVACSAEEALVWLGLNHYDAVTVDLRLPGQNGVTFIGALRSDERTRNLPVVVISALAREGQLQFDRKPHSVSDWLEKPIDENLLILSVRRAVAGLKSRKPRVLHVEDDPDIQCIAAAIAHDFADFEFAATLAEARARLREHRFDLVLLDLTLGEDSGWDLVENIDALDPRPAVIVFSSSEVDPAEGKRAEAVLLKAHTSNTELLNTIQRVLQIPGNPGPVRPPSPSSS